MCRMTEGTRGICFYSLCSWHGWGTSNTPVNLGPLKDPLQKHSLKQLCTSPYAGGQHRGRCGRWNRSRLSPLLHPTLSQATLLPPAHSLKDKAWSCFKEFFCTLQSPRSLTPMFKGVGQWLLQRWFCLLNCYMTAIALLSKMGAQGLPKPLHASQCSLFKPPILTWNVGDFGREQFHLSVRFDLWGVSKKPKRFTIPCA